MMRQGNLAGSGIDVATQQAGIAGRVVGRAERPLGHQGLPRRQQPHDAVDLGGFQGLFQG